MGVMDDTNLLPDEDWHKKIDSVVYHGMDWICPGDSQAMYNQITKHWGNLSAEVAIRDISAVETSGDTHLAYYDLKKMKMWVSFARQFVSFDLESLFAEPNPSGVIV